MGEDGRLNVFVLCTGRCGSVTFTRACEHITNYTARHESRHARIGDDRFAFPPHHIEVDMRLAWFLGGLARRFPDARYVHLHRDRDATAASFVKRLRRHPADPSPQWRWRLRGLRWRHSYPRSIIEAFAYPVVSRFERWPEANRFDVARFYVDTVNDRLLDFLRDRPHVTVQLETAVEDYSRFWDWIGAEGDLDAAMAEWGIRHNASEPSVSVGQPRP